MPTKPLDSMLNRDIDKVQAKLIIDIASPLLQEVINYATNAYERCRTSKNGGKEEAFPVLASFLHIIQMMDSIEVLISSGCGPPGFLLLRSSFEAKLGIEYILDRKGKTRALAWELSNIIDQINEFQRYDPSHQKGKEYRKLLSEDRLNYTGELPFLSETRVTLDLLHNLLKQPVFSDLYSEYKRLLKKRGRPPEWHSFFDGPRTIWALAHHLGQIGTYENLYRSWSKITHADDFAHLVLPLKNERRTLGPIRNPLHLVHIAATAVSFLIETIELLLKEYRTGELQNYRRWYEEEVNDRHQSLIKLERSQVGWFYQNFIKDTIINPK